jgi:AraC family transcriptional regulator of adaptative response / DNA-3-methyladenine glycosylase II
MLDPDQCYAAIGRRDPAVDGLFFTGVRTTGIYCRPICPARTPARDHVAFYPSAAAAQAAGFRPCLRCRPETAPDSPAWVGTLASVQRALRLIDEGALVGDGVAALAARLGMTDRHLRRLFADHLGVGPVAVERTRRVNLAKQLIHDTRLPLTDIAFAAGFGSVRRFNEVFGAAFGRPPSALRRAGGVQAGAPVVLTIACRDGFVLEVPVAVPLPQGQAAVSPGRVRTLRVTLTDVPLPALGRALAEVKRVVLGGA